MFFNALSVSVVPSLPAGSFEEIENLFKTLQGVVSEMQIDIVDGQYVPLTSWPFTEENVDIQAELLRLQEFTTSVAIEMDCMVQNPEQYLDTFVQLGAQRVVIHVGSTTAYEEIIAHAQQHQYLLGFAVTNDTPLDAVYSHRKEIDYVQVMGIKEVGQQGQPFDVRTLARVRQLRIDFPEMEIAVDGSVNQETIPQLYAAGVTRFTPGSAIAKADNPADAYKHLYALVT